MPQLGAGSPAGSGYEERLLTGAEHQNRLSAEITASPSTERSESIGQTSVRTNAEPGNQPSGRKRD